MLKVKPKQIALARAELLLRELRTEITEGPELFTWIKSEVYIEDPHKVGATKVKFTPWPAQVSYLELIHRKRQTITLKARQLGVSWCTIIYCVWLSIFHSGVTVLVFSKDHDAAKEIIRRAKFIFRNLINKPVTESGRGDNQQQITFSNGSRFKAFPATKNAGTSFTATFLIVDEGDKMEFGRDLYTSIKPTIDDGGRIAVIFTAFGGDGLGRLLWSKASDEVSDVAMNRFFIPWHARPGRTRDWYNQVAAGAISFAHHRQEYPATADEALNFTNLEERFIRDEEQWDSLSLDTALSSSLPSVVALDAGITDDGFAMVAACWEPKLLLPVIRDAKLWIPKQTETKTLDLETVFQEVGFYLKTHRIRRVVYDPYQLASYGQTLAKTMDARAFGQNSERLIADTALRRRIREGGLRHDGNPELREHFLNADIKPDALATKLRMVKRSTDQKIDLAVAASMAVQELVTEFPLRKEYGATSEANYLAGNQSGLSGQQTGASRKPFDGKPSLIYDRVHRRE